MPAKRAYYRPGTYTMRRSVGYLMRIASNRSLPMLEDLFEAQELTFSQWTVLVALSDGQIATAGELARNICHDAGSLTRLVDQLATRGFVKRKRSDKDRRVVTLSLTPRGRRMYDALMPRVMDFWNGMLSDLGHSEVDTLIKLLTRLGEAIETATYGPKPAKASTAKTGKLRQAA